MTDMITEKVPKTAPILACEKDSHCFDDGMTDNGYVCNEEQGKCELASPPTPTDGNIKGTKQPTEPKTHRNWLDILLKIGLGVCIIVLVLMLYKVFSDDTTSDTGKGKGKDKEDDFTIFPGLFDEPITLFERGDNQIHEINEEIELLEKQLKNYNEEKMNTVCNKYNSKISGITGSGDNYYNQYFNLVNSCKNAGCSIDKEQAMGQCKGKSKNTDDPKCKKAYIINYSKNMTKHACPSASCVLHEYKDKQSMDSDSGSQAYDYLKGESSKLVEGQGYSKTPNLPIEKIISKRVCKADGLEKLNKKLSELKRKKENSLSYKVQFG